MVSQTQDTIEPKLDQWRAELMPEQFHVTRLDSTERPFTGAYWQFNQAGLYRGVCRNTALFASDTTFEAGYGCPSYFSPPQPEAVIERADTSHGMVRTEIICAICEAHLGHVFPDGLPLTGLRYCTNSARLVSEAFAA